jgi:pyruvate/2-oxoglutarate dehydrogenase complex dihydrolipoamide acyltransferase (E2) component
MTVTLLADHRLLDGVPAARALAALEATLKGEIADELRRSGSGRP